MAKYRVADDLIRAWFQGEALEFKGAQEDLMAIVGEWVLAAYLQGHEEGLEEGLEVGHEEGGEEGHQDGYDEGYEDAKAEYEFYD